MSAVVPTPARPAAPGRGAASRAALHARWNTLAERERRAVRIALVILALAVLWWGLLAPALRTLRVAQLQQPMLEAQLQQMRALREQALALQAAPKLNYDDALRALEGATKKQLGNSAQISVLGDRVTVTLKGASADAIAEWLARVRRDARALPSEARLAPSPVAGSATDPAWDGSVVLALPAR